MNAMYDNDLTLTLPECLTVAEVLLALARFETEMDRYPQTDMVINASLLKTFDSSALALLLGLRRRQHARGKALRVKDCPQRLNDLAATYGLQAFLAA
jgi:phospholipid transport system transporter-binding protein